MTEKQLTSFRAKAYKSGKSSYVVVVPKSKFDEKILDANKEYDFSVKEVQ